MPFLQTKSELHSFLNSLPKTEKLGLVPTMGALHQGHISLVKKALEENKSVVVSIFVNPTQFNNQEDLQNYPQTLDEDIGLLKTLSDTIAVFAPSVAEVYDNNIETKTYDFDGLDKVMEGEFRDDHFNGVATIVETLFRLVQPDTAYFGEKDYQQLQIIKKMVQQQKLPVQIIGCAIVRETSGLAMSSRNERLSKPIRQAAAFIYNTLITAKTYFGTKSAKETIDWVTNEFANHADFALEYITIADADTLQPIEKKQKDKKYRAFVAVYAEDVRLIDNIALN